MIRRCDIAIIGGGISGLATAYYLGRRNRNLSIALFEASRYWGGKIITERRDSRVIDWGPDSFITTKPDALELCEDLGLSAEIISSIATNSQTLVLSTGRLIPIPEKFFLLAPLDLATFWKSPLFSLRGKLRILLEPFQTARRDLEDESIGSFVRRRFGEEALRLLGGPLLAGIYMGDPDQLSIHSTFPQLVAMERSRGSVTAGLRARRAPAIAGRSVFVSLRDGMDTLPRTLLSRLEVALCPQTQVRKLRRQSFGYRLQTTNGDIDATRVVITVDPENAYSLLQPILPIPEFRDFGSVSSVAVIAVYGPEVSLPDAYGVLIPRSEDRQVAALSFTSKKFPGRVPAGESMMRVFLGGYNRESVAEKDDKAILQIVSAELKDILGITATPHFTRVVRWGRANPQYLIGHAKRMDRIHQVLKSLPDLYLAGSAYGGIGIPDCVAQAKQLAAAVADG